MERYMVVSSSHSMNQIKIDAAVPLLETDNIRDWICQREIEGGDLYRYYEVPDIYQRSISPTIEESIMKFDTFLHIYNMKYNKYRFTTVEKNELFSEDLEEDEFKIIYPKVLEMVKTHNYRFDNIYILKNAIDHIHWVGKVVFNITDDEGNSHVGILEWIESNQN